MGAEDFSYYLQRIPDDDLIPLVIRLWARLAGAPVP
jgi:hypothetical protein